MWNHIILVFFVQIMKINPISQLLFTYLGISREKFSVKVRKVDVDGGVALESYQCLHVQVADLSENPNIKIELKFFPR